MVHGCMAVDLPPYQYAYGPIQYHESRLSKEFRARNIPHHDLIGSKLPGTAKHRPQWRNILRIKDLAWLGDHRLLPHAVFPAAGYTAMAIEAAMRAYNELSEPLPITGFSLRNLSIGAALRIPEDDHGIEVVFSAEPSSSATAKASGWIGFSISSVARDSNAWTEHCTGSVRVEVAESKANPRMSTRMDSRVNDTKAWYKKFTQMGLGYGPTFQGLSEIQADPTQSLATAKVNLKTTKETIQGESRYPLHPASLDAVYQLGLISCHSGQMDRMRTAYVPIHINRMYIKNGNPENTGTAIARGELRGLRGAYARLQMVDQSDEVVLEVEQLRCASYTDGPQINTSTTGAFSAPMMRLAYRPDIRSMTNEQARAVFPAPPDNVARTYLFDKFERLGTLIVAEIYDGYAHNPDMADAPEHIRHFLGWVRRRMDDDNQWVEEAKRLTSSERVEILEEIFEEVDFCSDVRICRHLFYNIDDVLYGRKTGLDVVVEDGRLHALYENGVIMTGAYPQLQKCFDSLGHANPSLNILEIGAGTGGATRMILNTLTGDHGMKRYQSYTFTDITSGFLNAARESLAEFKDMNFSVLDVEQDPLKNGFEPIYDVVVASECLHATACIAQTLENCRKLLRPGGKLVLVENVRTVIGMGVVLGTLTGYWSGIPDGRVDSPFLDLEGWNTAMIKSGFSGAELVLDDYPQPYTTACTIVSTAVENNVSVPKPVLESQKDLYLLHCGPRPQLFNQLTAEMTKQGISSSVAAFDDVSLPSNARVIAYLGDGEVLISMSEARLQQIQRLVRSSASMVWVTNCGLIQGKNPNAGVALGLLRTIGTENPTSRFQFLDIDPECDFQDVNLSRGIIQQEESLQAKYAGEMEDREFVWQQGCFWVSRLVPDSSIQDQSELARMPPSRAQEMAFDRHGPVRADFETPGILTSLYFKPYEEMDTPLRDDCIQVKVAAVGLNWKDMAISAGRFDMNTFSSEYSGVVDKVGATVTHLSVGDRVYGFGKGHFGNYVRVSAASAQRMQEEDDFVQMASMPLVYMTAIYAFEHATQIKPGEKVLIQSATGGLGLCAIQLARSMGAEIFCTVGTPDKVAYLAEKMGVPASHIFSSRDTADIPRLIEASGGRGFHVILSTATGDMLHESVKTLAPLGRYIDVGRVDVQNSLTMGLEFFQRSTTFSSFDLGVVMDANADMGRILMESLDKHYRAGHIGPIPAIISSDISRLDQVLLGFSKGTHVGKHVVTFQNPDALVRMVPPVPRARFDPEAQYVITGGLGGLGRSILNWMASRGARHLTVLSRSGACSVEAQGLIDDLSTKGVTVQSVRCDVTEPDQVIRVLEEGTAKIPIRGLVHAAVSYEDLSFDKLSIEQWQSGLAAKVVGTRNLHEATKSLPLDFFVMTTSIESVLALATQSAYTAANTFQELFARYRRRQGLPASTTSYGHITDLGHLSKNTTTINLMARNKVLGISEHEVLRLLEPAFLNNETTPLHEGKDPWLGATEDPLSAVTVITCMDPRGLAAHKQEEVAAGGGSANIPRWYTDGRVSLVMRAFADAERHQQSADDANNAQGNGTTGQIRQQFDEAIKAGPGERNKAEALVAGSITKTVAEMLFVDASGVDANKTVAEYGVDSLIAAELRNWFNTAFQAEISMLDLLDTRTTMKVLAKMIVDGALAKQA
ncbi:polyketide synthase dehydratase-domain-containing protein [Aspergillus avenaceus]|uniref:Polyketide synthase dehydratase-domain-containing protein n=1 Tax=Aspergillus avenaceus TaxID=36643 RepID=A0A5N6U0D7_ASPAV|nr:polyketide synthase dehydratase-domain-containing protein [Aspergillus avenaceus]